MSRRTYEVRYREKGKGRDGGYGPVKSFLTTASSAKGARKKMRKSGQIISIRTM